MQEGSLVMCVKKQHGPWRDDFGVIDAPNAVKNGIYLVNAIAIGNDGSAGLILRELPTYYGVWNGKIFPCTHRADRFVELLPPLCMPENHFNQSSKQITV